MSEFPNLKEEDKQKAKKEMDEWKYRAVYWHNSVPNFNYNMRGTLTEDVAAVTNIQSLELNKKLFTGIQWNNWITVCVSLLNLVLLAYNLLNL